MADTFDKMDRMYRYQRYFYDLTRKFYLLGRDQLIREMKIGDGDNVLEAGCGTGRNLIILARRYRDTNFFGLDASAAMLETAKANAAGIPNISFATELADNFRFDRTFGLQKPFDAIYFSYSISMIPAWQGSILNALENLRPGGRLYIVDFFDQEELPSWFRKLLQAWLRQFHVKFPEDLPEFLRELERNGSGRLNFRGIYKRYSFIAEFEKNPRLSPAP